MSVHEQPTKHAGSAEMTREDEKERDWKIRHEILGRLKSQAEVRREEAQELADWVADKESTLHNALQFSLAAPAPQLPEESAGDALREWTEQNRANVAYYFQLCDEHKRDAEVRNMPAAQGQCMRCNLRLCTTKRYLAEARVSELEAALATAPAADRSGVGEHFVSADEGAASHMRTAYMSECKCVLCVTVAALAAQPKEAGESAAQKALECIQEMRSAISILTALPLSLSGYAVGYAAIARADAILAGHDAHSKEAGESANVANASKDRG